MSEANTLVLSGIPLGEGGGTARFLRRLQSEYEASSSIEASMDFRSHVNPFRKVKRRLLGRVDQYVPVAARVPSAYRSVENLILFHPQGLGYRFATKLLRSREHSWHFILDSSFFCLRSYNYIKGESSACMRCLEKEESVVEMGCKHFPYIQGGYQQYRDALKESGRQISYFVQSEIVEQLLRQVVGAEPRIEVVGMAADYPAEAELELVPQPTEKQIVFHSHPLNPKGCEWTIQLAKRLPKWKFLFPFAKGAVSSLSPSDNCEFRPMTWENGLKDAVESSSGVLCPSLWSAPVEGAFVKSILHGHTVGYVDIPSAATSRFSSDTACVAMDSNLDKAAAQLEAGLGMEVTPEMRRARLVDVQDFVGHDASKTQVERMMSFVLNQ